MRSRSRAEARGYGILASGLRRRAFTAWGVPFKMFAQRGERQKSSATEANATGLLRQIFRDRFYKVLHHAIRVLLGPDENPRGGSRPWRKELPLLY